jgi:effector-binding domain-containing protein
VRGDVTLRAVDPTPTAVVKTATTWAEFPGLWRPMLEVGVQVTGSFEPHGSVMPSALPGGVVAAATHSGPVAGIGETHDAVRAWATARGYRPAGPRWEIYGDPDTSTGDFTVEVMWLVEQAS